MRHPSLAAQELWQKWNCKIFFFSLKIWVLTHVLWTSEPSHLFGLLLNIWQYQTQCIKALFLQWWSPSVLFWQIQLFRRKKSCQCAEWSCITSCSLNQAGLQPWSCFQGIPLPPQGLGRMRGCSFSQSASHKHTLVSGRSHTSCCWLRLRTGIIADQPQSELHQQTFNARLPTKYFRQKN